jgi:hypothetical protein
VSSSIEPSIPSIVANVNAASPSSLASGKLGRSAVTTRADEVREDVLGVIQLDVGEVAGVPGDVGDQETRGLGGPVSHSVRVQTGSSPSLGPPALQRGRSPHWWARWGQNASAPVQAPGRTSRWSFSRISYRCTWSRSWYRSKGNWPRTRS